MSMLTLASNSEIKVPVFSVLVASWSIAFRLGLPLASSVGAELVLIAMVALSVLLLKAFEPPTEVWASTFCPCLPLVEPV